MKKHEKMITESIIHIMGYMVERFVKCCFLIALDDELSDLKGLVDPSSICEAEPGEKGSIDVELALLDTLNNPHVKGLMHSIKLIVAARDRYHMINNMDFIDLDYDEKAVIQAGKTFHRFFPSRGKPKIKTRRGMIRFLPQWYDRCFLLFWACASQVLNNRVSVSKTTEQDYHRVCALLPFNELGCDNKNAELLYALLTDLQESKVLMDKTVKK